MFISSCEFPIFRQFNLTVIMVISTVSKCLKFKVNNKHGKNPVSNSGDSAVSYMEILMIVPHSAHCGCLIVHVHNMLMFLNYSLLWADINLSYS